MTGVAFGVLLEEGCHDVRAMLVGPGQLPGLAGPRWVPVPIWGLSGRLGTWGALFGSGVAIHLLLPNGKASSAMFSLNTPQKL